MAKTRAVSAINNGVVIDHIPAGQALKIMRLLHAVNSKNRVTLGLNLTSHRLKLKDLIKIENRKLSQEEIDQISVFSPSATINFIEDFLIRKKIECQLPETIRGILICPNHYCISRVESSSYFRLEASAKEVNLYCFYCEKQFKQNQFEASL
jgi:aspartate carbamoyltransferase regulatory subunit